MFWHLVFSIYPHQTKVYKKTLHHQRLPFQIWRTWALPNYLILPFRNLLQPENRSAKTMGTVLCQHSMAVAYLIIILNEDKHWQFFFVFLDGFCLATIMRPESPPFSDLFRCAHHNQNVQQPKHAASCFFSWFSGIIWNVLQPLLPTWWLTNCKKYKATLPILFGPPRHGIEPLPAPKRSA